jgi:glycosyltransferase involved in cell wall biosynthesis
LQGEVPYEKMATWYREANLFVSASTMETYGISLQEARHFGLPMLVVAGGNSGNHLRPGVTGSVYADPSALAAGFVELVRQPALLSSYLQEAQAQRPTHGGSWQESADALLLQLEAWFPCS